MSIQKFQILKESLDVTKKNSTFSESESITLYTIGEKISVSGTYAYASTYSPLMNEIKRSVFDNCVLDKNKVSYELKSSLFLYKNYDMALSKAQFGHNREGFTIYAEPVVSLLINLEWLKQLVSKEQFAQITDPKVDQISFEISLNKEFAESLEDNLQGNVTLLNAKFNGDHFVPVNVESGKCIIL